MLKAFEEMILSCVDKDAKQHIVEAVRCYEVGAYRAAIVSTYVSVCFDLIAKLRSLASSGDAEANQMVEQLDKMQGDMTEGVPLATKRLLEFERDLLEAFRTKFDFFGSQEFGELARLREDRNRCAHPSFTNDALPYSPPAELARLHIRSAITHVLSQQPKQGKAAIYSLRKLITSEYFPSKHNEILDRLKNSEIGNPRLSLIKSFVDDLCFGWPKEGHPYYHQPNAINAIKAVCELHRSTVLPRVVYCIEKLALTPEESPLRLASYLVATITDAGEQINAPTQSTLRSWLSQNTLETRGVVVNFALAISWWREKALEILENLTVDEIVDIKQPRKEIITQASKIYSRAQSWHESEELAVKLMLPLSKSLEKPDIEVILSSYESNQFIKGSNGFSALISAIYEREPITAPEMEELLGKYKLEAFRRINPPTPLYN